MRLPDMDSDIIVLRGLSKRIDVLIAHDESYVTQLDSISQTLIHQLNDAKHIPLLDLIAKDVYKLLILAMDNFYLNENRNKLVLIMKKCVEKLRAISASAVGSSVVFPHVRNCSEKDLKVKSILLKEVFASLLSFGCMEVSAVTAEEALNCLNYILTGASRPQRLLLSKTYKSELVDLVNFLRHCGDYTLQEVIMETFTRMAPTTFRESGCIAWFQDFPPQAQKAFLEFGKVVFQLELRPFLNAVNEKWKTGVHTLTCNKLFLGELELHNPESEHLPKFFVDFSKASQIISFCGVQDKSPFEVEGNPLVFIKISNKDIKTSMLIATNKPNYYQLTIVLENPMQILSHTKYHCETVINMILKAFDLEIFKSVIGKKLEADMSKLSSQGKEQNPIDSKEGKNRVQRKPGFNMFINADDNQKVPETNAKTSFATPMILDRSPGKSTYADYMTVVDSVENLETPEFIARNSTPAAKKHVMPSKATPATITDTELQTPTSNETSDQSEKLIESKKLVSSPVTRSETRRKSTQAANIQQHQQQDEELPVKQARKIGRPRKQKSTIEIDEEPSAKQPRRQPRKCTLPVKPKVERPNRKSLSSMASKPRQSKQEPKVPVRKSQPNMTTQEAAGNESENYFIELSSGNPSKRRMSSKVENKIAQKKNQPSDDSSPEVLKVMLKEPKLFELQDKLDSSSKPNKVTKKRAMQEESKKPAQKVLKSSTAANKRESKINQEELMEMNLDEDDMEITPDKEEDFLKVPAKKEKSYKLKLISKQLLVEDREKKLLERESFTDIEECEEEKLPKMTQKAETLANYFEELFCNSNEVMTKTLPSPKKKLQVKKKVSESSSDENQTTEVPKITEGNKLKLILSSSKEDFKNRSGHTLNKFLQPNKTQSEDDESHLMQSKTTAFKEAPKNKAKQFVKKRLGKKQFEPETSEDEEAEVPKPRKKSESQQQNASSSSADVAKMDHNVKLLFELKELHKTFNQREIKAQNSFRLELALKMKEELKVALKEEKKELNALNDHLQLTKEINNSLLKEFNLSKLKDHTAGVTELVEQLQQINDCHFDPKDLQKLAKEALANGQKEFFKDIRASVCSILPLFKRV